MSEKKAPKATQIIIPCRLSYAHIWEPGVNADGTPGKYSASLLVDKKDKETIAKIEKATEAAITAGKSTLANAKGVVVRNKLKLPLRDADEEGIDDPAYEGMMFLNASSKYQPGIVNRKVEDILDQNEVYSGCYCNVDVNFYAFSREGNKGIAVGLNNIQKLKHVERLAGGRSAKDAFTALDDEDEDGEEDFL